jgi:hypothetical protein
MQQKIKSESLVLDVSNSNFIYIDLNSNITTFVLSELQASQRIHSFVLQFICDGTPRVVHWPKSIRWSNGLVPTLSYKLNKVDTFEFITRDNGNTWFGFVKGTNA